MNSWLPSMRWPDCARDGARDRHRLRERRAPSARAPAAPGRATSARSNDGSDSGGSADGSAPTVAHARRRPRRASSHASSAAGDDRRRSCTARAAGSAAPDERRRASHDADRTVHGSTSRDVRDERRERRARSSGRGGTSTPKKLRSCAPMIRRPAPAVKPTMTVVRDEVDERAEPREAERELDQADHQASVSTSVM